MFILCHTVLQILKNHVVPGMKLSTEQLRTQATPLPNLLGQSLQVRTFFGALERGQRRCHTCPSENRIREILRRFYLN